MDTDTVYDEEVEEMVETMVTVVMAQVNERRKALSENLGEDVGAWAALQSLTGMEDSEAWKVFNAMAEGSPVSNPAKTILDLAEDYRNGPRNLQELETLIATAVQVGATTPPPNFLGGVTLNPPFPEDAEDVRMEAFRETQKDQFEAGLVDLVEDEFAEPEDTEETQSVTVRLRKTLVALVDAYKAKMNSALVLPGPKFTRTDAIGMLLYQGLRTEMPKQDPYPPDRVTQGLMAPCTQDTDPVFHPVPFILSGPEEDLANPFNQIELAAGQRVDLETWPGSCPSSLIVVDLCYEGPPDSLKIDRFTIGGSPDLLPYEGKHPAEAWRGMCVYPHTKPKLRSRPLCATPNGGFAEVINTSDKPIRFRLFMIGAMPSERAAINRLLGEEPGSFAFGA